MYTSFSVSLFLCFSVSLFLFFFLFLSSLSSFYPRHCVLNTGQVNHCRPVPPHSTSNRRYLFQPTPLTPFVCFLLLSTTLLSASSLRFYPPIPLDCGHGEKRQRTDGLHFAGQCAASQCAQWAAEPIHVSSDYSGVPDEKGRRGWLVPVCATVNALCHFILLYSPPTTSTTTHVLLIYFSG